MANVLRGVSLNWALGVIALLAGPAGCAREIATAPTVAPVSRAALSSSIEMAQSGCGPEDRACGGIFGQIGGYPITYNHKSLGPGMIGAYSKTWIPTGGIMPISMWAEGNIRRGATNHPFTLRCDETSSWCADLVGLAETCAHEKNWVKGRSWHSAGQPYTASRWTGSFSTYVQCEPPGSCGGEDTRIFDDANYDPYSESGSSGSCSSGGDGGGGGAGTQYEPGDLTGGQTVDWSTGIGNGGSSVCGDKAIVDYVCIDYFNEETQEWVEWGCGYVTIC